MDMEIKMNDAEYHIMYIQTIVVDGLLWGRAMCYDADRRILFFRDHVIG